ncbi:replication-relaxation family protein [Streptomyces sp. NPDC057072]|uniref:replication-relaxation family protein n=1 Tax=Streptomyces sp. NPDC057072 TaxID=3346014 RepID=UPI00362E79A3
MTNVDAGSGDRLALAVLTQYRMATTEQMHRILGPEVRIEQTRRRLAKLRVEGLVDRITLPQAGRLRVWFSTQYGVQVASEWPELRGRRPPKSVSDPTAARLRVGSMLRAFVEVDRATMGPERLAAKLTTYAGLHRYTPAPLGRRQLAEPPQEEWRRHYPLFPRLLFVLSGTGPAGIETRIGALRAAATTLALSGFLREVPVLAAPLTDLLQHGPSAPVWRPVQDPDQRASWMR